MSRLCPCGKLHTIGINMAAHRRIDKLTEANTQLLERIDSLEAEKLASDTSLKAAQEALQAAGDRCFPDSGLSDWLAPTEWDGWKVLECLRGCVF